MRSILTAIAVAAAFAISAAPISTTAGPPVPAGPLDPACASSLTVGSPAPGMDAKAWASCRYEFERRVSACMAARGSGDRVKEPDGLVRAYCQQRLSNLRPGEPPYAPQSIDYDSKFGKAQTSFPGTGFSDGRISQAVDDAAVRSALMRYCMVNVDPTAEDDDASKLICVLDIVNRVGLDYTIRARGRQDQADLAATVSVISVAALVIGKGKMVEHTKDLWQVGSVLPIMADDIRAPSYRGKLYSMAANSMARISDKYVDLYRGLGDFETVDIPDPDKISDLCNQYDDWARVMGARDDESRVKQFLEELTKRRTACRAQEAAARQLTVLKTAWPLQMGRLGDLAGRNARDLVTQVEQLDRSLKADPFTAVRTAAAAPLQKIADFVSGDNTAAYKQRQDMFDGKRFKLTLSSGIADGDVPGELSVIPPAPESLFAALNELVGDGNAAVDAATKANKAEDAKKGAEVVRVLREAQSRLDDFDLENNAKRLNVARQAARKVLDLDKPLTLDLDPRNAVLDQQAVADAAEAKKKAEADTAQKAADDVAGAKDEPKADGAAAPASPGG